MKSLGFRMDKWRRPEPQLLVQLRQGDFKFKAHLGNLMGCSLKIKSKHGAGDIAQWSGTLA